METRHPLTMNLYLDNIKRAAEILKEEDYRAEIQHLGEFFFKRAMNDALLMYDGGTNGNIKKQVFFIEQGLIGGWFGSVHQWRKKLPNYQDKYPQKSVDI